MHRPCIQVMSLLPSVRSLTRWRPINSWRTTAGRKARMGYVPGAGSAWSRSDASAPTLASYPAGTFLWHGARLLLSRVPVYYSTTGGQGRFSIRQLAHGAQLPVLLFPGSNAG